MIRHIVFFTAKNKTDLPRIREGLEILGQIEHCAHFEVGTNHRIDNLSEMDVDLVVYAEFADKAALAAYKAHPLYQKSIALVRPLRDMRVAADFTSA